MPIRDGIGFVAFDDVVRRSIPGSGNVERRLRQAVSALALGNWMQLWAAATARGAPPPGARGEPVRTRAGTFFPGHERFRPSWRILLGEAVTGAKVAGIGMLAALVPERRSVAPGAILLLGTGDSDVVRGGSDARFIEFCRSGPVKALHAPAPLVVQRAIDATSATERGVVYARRPIYRLLRMSRLGVGRRTVLASQLLAAYAGGLARSLIRPVEVLLLRDRVEAPIIGTLVGRGALREVVVTNSSWARQPLWMRDGTVATSMVWYSENSKWIWRLGPEGPDPDLPPYRHMQVGAHWVWTGAHAAWLRHLGHVGPIHVIGPILWYLPRTALPPLPPNVAWVTVFDIMPVTAKVAARIGFVDNFYSTARCIAFIDGIVGAARVAGAQTGIDVRVRIKPKRVQPNMDRAYADALVALERSGVLTTMDFAQDLFELTRDSAISVVQPFSSPALVAAHVGARACFFDVGADLSRPSGLDAAIEFVQDREALASLISDSARAWASRSGTRLRP